MNKLTANDELCGTGQIVWAGKLDKDQAGRVNRNGNSVIWYPPKGGLPKDVTEVTFQYVVGFEYFDAIGRKQMANSTAADVTISFASSGEDGTDPGESG